MTKQIPLTGLKPGPYQSRTHFQEDRLLQLAQSIEAQGLIHPIIVATSNGDGSHPIIAGERRWRASAACILARLDLAPDLPTAIQRVAAPDGPAYIRSQQPLAAWSILAEQRPGSPRQLHLLAIVDNHQRADLNPIEEAQDFQNLIDRYNWSVGRIAQEIGHSATYVSSRLAWLQLEPEIQQIVAAGNISKDWSVAKALASLPTPEIRLKLARRFAGRGSSIAAIQRGCQRVIELLEQKAQQQTVNIQQATIKPKLNTTTTPPPTHTLCPGDAAYIRHLAEEFCGPCSIDGLTADCLTCPGTIEFIEKLIQAARDLETASA